MIRDLYEWASDHAPAMVIIEDVETLVGQTQVTRSGFLNILDGLKVERGVLTVATTNYPDKLDPALAHRPSRFDRVWRIPLPGDAERRVFLKMLFADPPIAEDLCESIVRRTHDWSMAYIQEIKATAVVYAVQQDRDYIAAADIEQAVDALAKQFRSGQQFHRKDNDSATLGFGE
jgi:ATP-dependent 26S proteasome regulatory subunit